MFFNFDYERIANVSKPIEISGYRRPGLALDDLSCCFLFVLVSMLLLNSWMMILLDDSKIFLDHTSGLEKLLEI